MSGRTRATADNFSVRWQARYHGAVFGNVGRRLLEGTVGLFAVLGFLYVPLGRQTGFEHARAVFTTPAATAAIQDMTRAAFDLRSRALDWISGRAQSAIALPTEPKRSQGNGPRPVPPKLKSGKTE